MNILVTGGAGFIGSHLVDRLLLDGFSVTVVDSFDPFYPRGLKEDNIAANRDLDRYRLVEADIRDLSGLRSAIDSGYDAIVHLAARAGVRPSILDPVGYQETNVCGTQNLLELARELGVKQFVFASSSSVYGINPKVPWTEEDHVLLPISPYASTKISGELLGHVYSHLHGIRFVGLRFFTVYGPRQRPDLAIHKFARRMLAGESIPVYGDGSTRRDYTYVDDIVEGLVAAITYSQSDYEIMNLGNDRTVGLLEMIGVLELALGTRASLEYLPPQPGDVPRTWASVNKAASLLGYRPSTDFAAGIEAFVRWLEREVGAPHAPH